MVSEFEDAYEDMERIRGAVLATPVSELMIPDPLVVDAIGRACKDGTATRAEVLKELHKTNLKTSIFGDPISFNAHGDRIGAHFFQFQITKKGPVPVK